MVEFLPTPFFYTAQDYSPLSTITSHPTPLTITFVFCPKLIALGEEDK